MSIGTEVGAGVDVAVGTAEHATPMTAIRATKPGRMRDFIIISLLKEQGLSLAELIASGRNIRHREKRR
jgi:hypothetical protein